MIEVSQLSKKSDFPSPCLSFTKLDREIARNLFLCISKACAAQQGLHHCPRVVTESHWVASSESNENIPEPQHCRLSNGTVHLAY